MNASHIYAVADWFEHTYYGIGQIKGIEAKDISGASVDYFWIQTTDSTFWVPVDRMDSEKNRPFIPHSAVSEATRTPHSTRPSIPHSAN